jgi:glycosyltransferase involved in cell wall biosynthesis
MINVQYDSQIFEIQRRGGITKYFKDLIHWIPKQSQDIETKLLFKYVRTKEFDSSFVKSVDLPYFVFKKTLGSLNRKCLIDESSILHTTYYLRERLKKSLRSKYIVTIHDMIDEDYPNLVTPPPFETAKEEYCRNASGIICVSNNTKSRLLDLYGNDLPPIEVIHHGVNLKREIVKSNAIDRPPYFIYVGNRQGYKNASRLIEAVPLILKEIPSFKLNFVGGERLSKFEENLISRLGVVDAIQFRNLDDSSLQDLYSKSHGYISTSLEEGFGIPILEAAFHGCIPILSDIEVYREIAGKTALYFDPLDIHSIASTVCESILQGTLNSDRTIVSNYFNKYDLEGQIRFTSNFYKKLQLI